MKPKEFIKSLPGDPGIYKFFDKEHIIIYVGKAKNIKKRVSSYFNTGKPHNLKTRRLIQQIQHIEYTIVNSETDALFLENNLIKTYQPKYNILLKDDKSYPYIGITQEPFPKIISLRNPKNFKGNLYGPFSNVKAMHSLIELIRNLFYIRTCQLHLSSKNINENKFKVCLEYHLHNCKGPCEGLQSEDDYLIGIQQADHILKGNLSPAKDYLTSKMEKAAEKQKYEEAQQFKDRLQQLEKYKSKSQVVNPTLSDLDTISIITNANKAAVNYLHIQNGSIIHTETMEIKKILDESDVEIITHALLFFRQKYDSQTKHIIANIPIPSKEFSCIVPQIGDKKKLIDISLKNAFSVLKRIETQAKTENENAVLNLLKKELQLKEIPYHIECFDNSNIQGAHPVASMVCFKNGQPSKKDYRKYHIKTVVGPDDFSSMHEVVYRRYQRLLDEKSQLPQLIIIDGGKGQLSAACNALKKLHLYGKISIIGIAKRLEEIYFPEDQIPLLINKKSPSLKLIQRIRNEAHRFAITFHRNKRSKDSLKSELLNIEGIGNKTVQLLLNTYQSPDSIINQSEAELSKIIGNKKATVIVAYFQKKKE